MSATVRYVGDPFVDSGVAVLENRINKPHTEFSDAELISQAEWLVDQYSRKIWTGYLTVHFPNSGWCNATMSAENKAVFRNSVLHGFGLPLLDRACAYCGRPAQDLADRSKIPLLTGAVSMVAGPGGAPGLPVCGYCVYAVQFYPLAALKVEGKPLFWWTSESQWLFYLTGEFMQIVDQVLAFNSDSFTNARWPSTRLLDAASHALKHIADQGELRLADVVGCHATNYGSGPDYGEIRIPSRLLEFLAVARQYPTYDRIVESQWDANAKSKGDKKKAATDPEAWQRRNGFYEGLGVLLRSGEDAEAARLFVRQYFVNLKAAPECRSFELTRLFLERMTDMTRERLNAIERLAARVAESSKWKDFVERLFKARNIIGALLEIDDRLLSMKEKPLSTNDVYAAFDIISDDDTTSRDSYFVRDVILLKILELRGEPAIPDSQNETSQEA
jgi:CRISPR-associated protein Cst1